MEKGQETALLKLLTIGEHLKITNTFIKIINIMKCVLVLLYDKNIPPATALSFPVTRTVAGQDQESRHNGSGKSSNGWEDVLTARKSARGT